MLSNNSPFRLTDEGVAVAVRLQAGARRNRIDGSALLVDGTAVLRARVSEPPEKGKANTALIKLLSKAWRLPKSSIEIQSGRSERRKTLLVVGGSADRLTSLHAWLKGLGKPEDA